jgi:hypothetical protein
MEHWIYYCNRRLVEVLMPELCRVRDHQQVAARVHHVLETVVLKLNTCAPCILASKLPRQAFSRRDVDNDTDIEWAK